MKHWARLFALGAALLLTGCLWTPGKFTSELLVRKNGTFVLDYRGEILLQRPDEKAKAEPWADSMARCFEDGRTETLSAPPEKIDSSGEPAPAERYDPATDSWTELDAMPKNVGSVGAAFLGGLLVAVGGESTTEASDAVQAYDVEAKQWSQLPALPAPRHGAAITALDDSLFAIGGTTAAGHVQSTATATVLDLD